MKLLPEVPTNLSELIAALRCQRQVDADGVECGVSRQAVDESVAFLERVAAAPKVRDEPAQELWWLIERNSSPWGCEWWCAGENRWTNDAFSAIRFPNKSAAEEMWRALRISIDATPVCLPFDEEGIDWLYHYSATEHMFISAHPSPRIAELEDALRDMLSGWKYIREVHGDLYGVGWDRAQKKAEEALK